MIGLPAAWLASRMNRRLLRLMAWPAVGVSVALLLLTQTGLGFAVNGNRNWLALGPLHRAALGDRQALDHHLGRRRLRQEGEAARQPVAGAPARWPRSLADDRRPGRHRARPRHRAGAVRDPARACSGWSACPPGCSAIAISLVSVVAFYLAASNAERRTRLTSFIDPFKDFQGAGWQAGHGLLGMSSGGIFGKGLSASPAEVGQPARGAHRLHLRRARRGARADRHAARAGPVRGAGLRRRSGWRSTPPTRSSATSPPA